MHIKSTKLSAVEYQHRKTVDQSFYKSDNTIINYGLDIKFNSLHEGLKITLME